MSADKLVTRKKRYPYESYRTADMREVGFWLCGPVAMIIVLQAHMTDRQLYPHLWRASWVFMRMGIIPVCSLAMYLYRTKIGKRWPEIPACLVVFYITAFNLRLVIETGGISSKYSHAFVQLVLGAALLPFTPAVFLGLTTVVIGSYLLFAVHYGHLLLSYFTTGGDPWLRVYLLMGILFFYTINLVRKRSYRLTHELEVELKERETKIKQLVKSQLKMQEDRAVAQLAAQVAHDIRSPLAVLKILVENISGIDEEKRFLLRGSLSRLSGISSLLLAKYSNRDKTSSRTEPGSLLILLDTLLGEKRIQYSSRADVTLEIPALGLMYPLFCAVDIIEFRRVLSNLIDNAFESMPSGGRLTLAVSADTETIVLSLSDTGCGIPTSTLPHLFQSGATFGKPGGSGLGLFHAKQSTERWGGGIAINSQVGKGTTVILSLPRAAAPHWFVENLKLDQIGQIVIVDDDDLTHEIWKGRLPARADSVLMFHDVVKFKEWQKRHCAAPAPLYLIDYEFPGQPHNGFELIESLDLGSAGILVTNRYDDEKVKAFCERKAVRMIPKPMIVGLPILD